MGKVALREYHRFIERLIEDHKTDEALAHCENIVHVFPKDIETYRKTGKIFLEKQDYADAEKVFNIILSVFPDDFVANIGLSFINEQNNHMDQAIQHMQSAFELQPANESLQDELKRLYNKRDHVEPARIRLTRGALIKMYTRSDLYEQAIAEIRLGLHEKPGRIDYKLALADMLWKSGKHIDAVETCVDVISRLPYCWLANEILDKAFLEINPSEAKNNYRNRLTELDPYYQYMLPTTRAIADIPDIAVQIDNILSEDAKNNPLDWTAFLKGTWNTQTVAVEETAASPASDLNWDSILDEAMQEESAEPVGENVSTLVDTEQTDLSANRRQAFIERLQKRSTPQDTIAEVPNWVQEESQLAQPSAKIENSSEISAGNSEEQSAESTAAKVVMLPEIQEESGTIDHDAPVQIPDEMTENTPASQWVRDQSVSAMENKSKSKLQDTQEIRVMREETPQQKLEQARKALEGENIQFALKKIQEVSSDDTYLAEIKDILEAACERFPGTASLWLTLGNIYQRLGLKEKALEVFMRAQKQISL